MSDRAKTKKQLIAELGELKGRLAGLQQDFAGRRDAEPSDASESHFRRLVDYGLGLIYTHSLDGTLLSINPAAAAALG